MSRLLLGTTNPAKVAEFKDILGSRVGEIVTPQELNLRSEPVEDGESFAENSLLKANFYWQKSGLPCLTDDGGLEIDALGGRPGVQSRRWGGVPLSDPELQERVLNEIGSIAPEHRTARLTVVVTLRVNRELNFQSEASITGLIRPSKLANVPGYPFRSIFWLPQLEKFYSEITPAEHEQVSHRRKAIEELWPYLEQYL